MKRKLTLADIAELANVHKSTVSRALNEPDKVNPATKQKIEEIIKEYNFRPSVTARALAKGCTPSIAVIIHERTISKQILSPIFSHLIYGIGNVASQYNYNVTIITSRKQSDSDYIDIIKNNDAEGFIILGASTDDSFPELFIKENIPFIIIGKFPNIENSVSTNNEQGGYLAMNHLLRLQHRNITIIGGNDKWYHNISRLNGIRKATEEFNLDFSSFNIVMNQNTLEKSYNAFRDIVMNKNNKLPDAVLCLSDTAALGINVCAYDLGISIPKDFSLIGFGNQTYSEFTRPRLTTIAEQTERMGEIAMNNL